MGYTELKNIAQTTSFKKEEENSLFYKNWVNDQPSSTTGSGCSLNRERYYCKERCPSSIWKTDPQTEMEVLLSGLPRREVKSAQVLGDSNQTIDNRKHMFTNYRHIF